MEKVYVDTVRLLLETVPEVFTGDRFAMKGGTALNFFVHDMPRLSVDIDVVYLSYHNSRSEALADIRSELNTLRRRLESRGINAEVAAAQSGDETKMFIRRGRHQVKVEVNHVFRGTLMPIEQRSLVKAASDLFAISSSAPTLAISELYGSKLVAAMDRQHPRDLFDVQGMYGRIGLQPEIVECFVSYLAGHNRPVHEVLFSRDVEMAAAYENEFAGMTRRTVSLSELQSTRACLRHELVAALTKDHKQFLLGLVTGDPPWHLMSCRHLADLPAVQWKLQNLARLKKTNPAKFRLQAAELEKNF